MTASDEVTIATGTNHTVELARVMKEYAVAYEKWQSRVDQAKRSFEEAERAEGEASKLKPEVDKLRERIKEMMTNG